MRISVRWPSNRFDIQRCMSLFIYENISMDDSMKLFNSGLISSIAYYSNRHSKIPVQLLVASSTSQTSVQHTYMYINIAYILLHVNIGSCGWLSRDSQRVPVRTQIHTYATYTHTHTLSECVFMGICSNSNSKGKFLLL